jgi:RNA-directed DNA polymerase
LEKENFDSGGQRHQLYVYGVSSKLCCLFNLDETNPASIEMLGIPAIYDRVCRQALLNRFEPIFGPIFDDASFGYRRGRSTKDALRKVWKEIQGGSEWIVDADLRDFFGSVDHEKLLTLVAQRVADGRVLRLIKAMLKAGSYGKGQLFPSERGTPQGGVFRPRSVTYF